MDSSLPFRIWNFRVAKWIACQNGLRWCSLHNLDGLRCAVIVRWVINIKEANSEHNSINATVWGRENANNSRDTDRMAAQNSGVTDNVKTRPSTSNYIISCRESIVRFLSHQCRRRNRQPVEREQKVTQSLSHMTQNKRNIFLLITIGKARNSFGGAFFAGP